MQHSYFSVAVCILGILEDSTEAAARPDGNGLHGGYEDGSSYEFFDSLACVAARSTVGALRTMPPSNLHLTPFASEVENPPRLSNDIL